MIRINLRFQKVCDRNTLPVNVFFSILLNRKCSQKQYAAKLRSTLSKYRLPVAVP